MKYKKYIYRVFYNVHDIDHEMDSGNAIVKLDSPITSEESINKVIKLLENKFKITYLCGKFVVTNYKLLRKSRKG